MHHDLIESKVFTNVHHNFSYQVTRKSFFYFQRNHTLYVHWATSILQVQSPGLHLVFLGAQPCHGDLHFSRIYTTSTEMTQIYY